MTSDEDAPRYDTDRLDALIEKVDSYLKGEKPVDIYTDIDRDRHNQDPDWRRMHGG